MSAAPEVLFDRMRVAEDKALRNELNLAAHEKECAIRYGHINETMSMLNKTNERMLRVLLAVGSSGVLIGVTVVGFLLKLTVFK